MIYWGWVPALIWVILGSIFFGGVHDFGSMMVSLRNDGKSISEVSKVYISDKARFMFSLFVWFALILIIAVFAHLAAQSYVKDPHIVIPSLGLIPIAIMFGYFQYKTNANPIILTVLALILTFLLIPAGEAFPISQSYTLWIVVLPVQYLLQPRDYLSSYLLIGGMKKNMSLPAFKSHNIPMFPFLFVTVACGAISGFHSLISSGTSAKQIPKEMLLEGFLAVLVIAAVGSLSSGLDPNNPIGTFGKGVSNITPFLSNYGGYFAILVLNAFILTTLDTATRIARYITTEFFGIKNMFVSSFIVVICASLLLMGGYANNLWTVFGAANQLLAALSLFVVTLWALVYQSSNMIKTHPNIVALLFAICLFVLGIFVSLNSLAVIYRRRYG